MKPRKQTLLIIVLLLIVLPVGMLVHANLQRQRNAELLIAIKANDTGAVQRLLEQGADANARQVDHRSDSTAQEWKAFWRRLLHQAKPAEESAAYRLSALEILLAERCTPEGETSLPPENVEMVRALVDHGADPNVQSVPDVTPLTRAVCLKQEKVVSLLLGRGARPSPLLIEGDPLLLYCSTHMAALLIAAGAPVDSPDEKGRTPLMYLCGREKHSDWINSSETFMIEILPERLDPSIIPSVYSRVRFEKPNTDLLKPLILAGAQVNSKDKEGWTALMAAARDGDMTQLRILVNAGADISARDLQGKTALDHAAENWEDAPQKSGSYIHKPGTLRFKVRTTGHKCVTTSEYLAARNFLSEALRRQKQRTARVDSK